MVANHLMRVRVEHEREGAVGDEGLAAPNYTRNMVSVASQTTIRCAALHHMHHHMADHSTLHRPTWVQAMFG